VFSGVFASVSDVCCKCYNYFGHMLHVFYLDLAKVDLMLHMLQWDPHAQMLGCRQAGVDVPACDCRHGQATSGWHGPCVGVRNVVKNGLQALVSVWALAVPFFYSKIMMKLYVVYLNSSEKNETPDP